MVRKILALCWMKGGRRPWGEIRHRHVSRIAVAGDGACAGLAVALAQLARSQGKVKPAFQLLYPMLDDRATLRTDYAGRGEFVWPLTLNVLGWIASLGRPPELKTAPPYAAAARLARIPNTQHERVVAGAAAGLTRLLQRARRVSTDRKEMGRGSSTAERVLMVRTL